MQGFKGQFTKIKGVSDRRRLPRLNKIRLGVKAVSKKTGREHPKETDYFVVPPEVAKVYGERPKELDIMFPVNDPEVIFPQKYTWYGTSKGPKCIGDGEEAMRVNEAGEFERRECPCELLEAGDCQRRAHLLVLLPKVSVAGIYQIDTGSYNTIVDINSGIDYVQALVGRFAMVPCILKREPRETHSEGGKQTHYTLRLFINANVDLLNALRENTQRILTGPQFALPPPEDVSPALDDGAVVEYEDEEDAEPTGKPVEEESKKEPQPPTEGEKEDDAESGEPDPLGGLDDAEQWQAHLKEADCMDAWQGYRAFVGIKNIKQFDEAVAKAKEVGFNQAVKRLNLWWNMLPSSHKAALKSGKAVEKMNPDVEKRGRAILS